MRGCFGIEKFIWWSIVIVLPALLACGGGDDESENKASQNTRGGRPGMGNVARTGASIPVGIETAGRGDIAATLLTYTSLDAERHVDVVSRAQGLVKTIFVEEGDLVKEGQPLAQLDTDAHVLTVRERETNMKSLESNFIRAEELREKEFLSSQEFEQTKYQYEVAQTQYESAKLQLNYATILSPFAGTITERLIDVGNLVNVNDVVFRTADIDPLLARIFVPEKNISQVHAGQTVRINVEGADHTYIGKVARISPVVDPQSGTVKVTVEIKDRRGSLRPGMFATVNLVISIHEDALRIQKKALVAEAEGSYAFLFINGKAEKRLLEIGIGEGDYVEILSGLAYGDSIITVGQEGLRNGSPVRIAGLIQEPLGNKTDKKNISIQKTSKESRLIPEDVAGNRLISMDLDQIKVRMFRNPKIKELYEKKMLDDPEFANDEVKQRSFLIEQSQKFRGRRRALPE